MTTLRICFVGDSLVNGTNDPEFLGWPGRVSEGEVAAGHDVTTYNLGIRGDTSEMISDRWRKECEARLPEIQPCALVFSFGVNDIAFENGVRRVDFDRSLDVARELMRSAKDWLPTLWVGPPPVELDETTFIPAPGIRYAFSRERIGELSTAYANVATELGVPYFDLFDRLNKKPEWFQSFNGTDSVHPMGNGYAQIAQHLSQWDAWRNWFDK